MKLGNIGLKAKMMLGSCVPLILVLILGIISLMSLKLLLNTTHWVDHTHRVIESAMKIEAAAINMETGMRGFLISGKDKFLEPYNEGIGSVFKAIEELQKVARRQPRTSETA